MDIRESPEEDRKIKADRSDISELESQENVEKPLSDQDPYSDLADDIDVGPVSLLENEKFMCIHQFHR